MFRFPSAIKIAIYPVPRLLMAGHIQKPVEDERGVLVKRPAYADIRPRRQEIEATPVRCINMIMDVGI